LRAVACCVSCAKRDGEQEWGLRDFDRVTDKLVGLEFWRASERLPKELLDELPAPGGAGAVIGSSGRIKQQSA
jgi:hypothetical protein